MQNLKPFDPDEVDETLTRVVVHGRGTYLMFPYIDGKGATPRFSSVGCLIDGPAATVKDFAALASLAKQAGANAVWFISFNTPWLLSPAAVEDLKSQASQSRVNRR